MDRLTSLREQLEHHLRFLDHALGGVDLERARFRLSEAGPSIAWEVGHCARNVDSMLELVCATPRVLGEAFDRGHDRPHWGVADAGAWDGLRQDLERAGAALTAGLATLTDPDLDRPPAAPVHPAFEGRLTTRGVLLRGHVFHLAYHLGQVGLLRAAQGLGW